MRARPGWSGDVPAPQTLHGAHACALNTHPRPAPSLLCCDAIRRTCPLPDVGLKLPSREACLALRRGSGLACSSAVPATCPPEAISWQAFDGQVWLPGVSVSCQQPASPPPPPSPPQAPYEECPCVTYYLLTTDLLTAGLLISIAGAHLRTHY